MADATHEFFEDSNSEDYENSWNDLKTVANDPQFSDPSNRDDNIHFA